MRAWVLWLVLWASVAEGSYRVYQLRITEFDRRGHPLVTRQQLSTLDHLQWEHVYGEYRWAKVELVDTWYCPGDTSRRAFCPRPKFLPTRGPASTVDKRNGLPYGRQPVIP